MDIIFNDNLQAKSQMKKSNDQKEDCDDGIAQIGIGIDKFLISRTQYLHKGVNKQQGQGNKGYS